MATVFGILFYFFIATYLLWRLTRSHPAALTPWQIAIALAFKIIMGCIYGYVFLVKYDGDDTWLLHEYSLEQTNLLLDDPARFMAEMNPLPAFERYDDLETNMYYYLSDLEAWLMAKPFAVVNLITGGNYYINLVFFNLVVFVGHYWLYRMIFLRFSPAKWPLYLGVFFLPPVVFWLSGLRADGFLFFFIMLSLLQFNKLVRGFTWRSCIAFLLGLAGIFILRSVLLLLLLPALISWALVAKHWARPAPAFLGVYTVCLIIFLGSTLISPGKNFTSFVVNRQQAFFELEGNTRFHLDSLQPAASSFIRILPQAVNNSFLRPYPWEAKGVLQAAAAAEVVLMLLLSVLFVVKRRHNWEAMVINPLTLSLCFFAATLYVITGFTVPFPGAIVRYKIIGELFFLVTAIICIDWNWWLKRLTKDRASQVE